jgi:hypothetical protein
VLRLRGGVVVEVVLQGGGQVWREGDVTASGGALGGGDHVLAVDPGHRAVHLDDAPLQVEVFAAEFGDFAEAEAAPGGQQDHGLPVWGHSLNQPGEFFESGGGDGHDAAGGAAADVGGVGRDLAVVDGGLQDRPQQPVGVGPQSRGVGGQGRLPAPDHGGGDGPNWCPGEGGQDLLLKQGVNRPGMSGDSDCWEGWSHARRHAQTVPA